MEISVFKRWLHWLFQTLFIRVPALSEMRLAISKILEFQRVWHYLSRAKVGGDYYEFGVFEGMGFTLSMRTAKKFFAQGKPDSPRFFAFDSFQGIPENHPTRDTKVFGKGTYSASLELFKSRIKGAARGWEVGIIPGFFSDSLVPGLFEKNGMRSAAFVNIDCDIYDSTMDALRFVTPLLKTGTVLYFDDWYFSGGDMTQGEPGACADWLKDNPLIHLAEFGNVGIMGKLFIVNLAPK